MFSVPDMALDSISMMAGIMLCMIFLSMIGAETICNEKRMPYTGFAYEVRIKNYNLAASVAVILLFIVSSGCLICLRVAYHDTPWSMLDAMCISCAVIVLFLVFEFLIWKKLPQNDMI